MRAPLRLLLAMLGLCGCGHANLVEDAAENDASVVSIDAGIDAREDDAAVPEDAAATPDDVGDDVGNDAASDPDAGLPAGAHLVGAGATGPRFTWVGDRPMLSWNYTARGTARLRYVDTSGLPMERVDLGAIPGVGAPRHLWGFDFDGTSLGVIADADGRVNARRGAVSGRFALDGTPYATWTPRPVMELTYALVALPSAPGWATAGLRTAPLWGTLNPVVPADLTLFDGDAVPLAPTELFRQTFSATIGRNGDRALAAWEDDSWDAFRCQAREIDPSGALADDVFRFTCGNVGLNVVAHGSGYVISSYPPYGPIYLTQVDPPSASVVTEIMIPNTAGAVALHQVVVASDAAGARLAMAVVTATGLPGMHTLYVQELDPLTLETRGDPVLLRAFPDGLVSGGVACTWTERGFLVAWTEGSLAGPGPWSTYTLLNAL